MSWSKQKFANEAAVDAKDFLDMPALFLSRIAKRMIEDLRRDCRAIPRGRRYRIRMVVDVWETEEIETKPAIDQAVTKELT